MECNSSHLLTLVENSRKPSRLSQSLKYAPLGTLLSSDFPQTWLHEDLQVWATAHYRRDGVTDGRLPEWLLG